MFHRGDPEKHDNYGNTGLHLSSAKGHLNCVTFLINFGVNIWDLDIDMHSAKDLAAINNREDILKYLDSITSQQEMTNSKLAKSQQEKARKESEKRMKSFQKLQKKAEKTASKENEKIEKRRQSLHPGLLAASDNLRPSDGRRQSLGVSAFSSIAGPGSQSQPATVRYSDLISTVTSNKIKGPGTVFSKIQKKKERSEDIFTVRDGQAGTVRSLTGLRSGLQSDIVFRDKEATGEEEESEDRERGDYVAEPSSIFNRFVQQHRAVQCQCYVMTLFSSGRASGVSHLEIQYQPSMHYQ